MLWHLPSKQENVEQRLKGGGVFRNVAAFLLLSAEAGFSFPSSPELEGAQPTSFYLFAGWWNKDTSGRKSWSGSSRRNWSLIVEFVRFQAFPDCRCLGAGTWEKKNHPNWESPTCFLSPTCIFGSFALLHLGEIGTTMGDQVFRTHLTDSSPSCHSIEGLCGWCRGVENLGAQRLFSI